MAAQAAAVGASLIVDGLDDNVTDSQLYDLFSQIGEVVSVKVCQDLSSGPSIRYGYVSYRNPQCAQRALVQLNFTPLNGNPIMITRSHPEPSTSRSGDEIVYIENSENEIDYKALPIENTKSCNPDASGQSMGYGSVQFFDEASAQEGMTEVNGMLSKGNQVSTESSFRKPNIELSVDKAHVTNVFVKNFCESTTEDDLENIFGEFGLITSTVVMKNKGGTSKCCGMVNFENSEDAARAVEYLNGQIFGEKKWYVGRAQSKLERLLETKHHLECVKEAFDNGSNLYVKNLDHSIGDEKLKELFSLFGSVTSCGVLRDEKGNSRGTGFVAFSSPEEASCAISGMNGKVLVDKPLHISIAQRKVDKRSPLQNLGKEIDYKALPEKFVSSGDIHSSKVAKDASAHSKGYGFVNFSGEVTGQKASGELASIVGKFNGVITNLNGILIELNGIVRELNGLLLNGKQVNMDTEEIEVLADKPNFTNVLVKNFCESTTEEDLKKIFGEFGLVMDAVVTRNEDGTSKCFGFVNFEKAEDAARAVESLNGQRLEMKNGYSGRAQNKLERKLELKNTLKQYMKEAIDKESNLYVKHLDKTINDEKLKELFSSFGLVTSCKVNKDREGRSRRSGFVAFSSPEEASKAVDEMNGKILFGKPLYVALAQRKEDRITRLQNLDKEIDHKALPETFSSSVIAESCNVATDTSDQSMGFGSVPSSEKDIGVQNGMLLNEKQVYPGSSHNEKERKKLSDVFSPFRSLKSCEVMQNKISNGSGFVAFSPHEQASESLSEKNSLVISSMLLHVARAQRKEDRRAWLQDQPGFGYEKLLFPGVRTARPLMHSMSVPLIQKNPRPAPALKQQMLPRGLGYHCLPRSMLSVQYENECRLLVCDVGIPQPIPVGALASSLANASHLNRGRRWMKFCTRHLKR